MDKRFWAVIGIIVLIFGGIIIANKKQASAPDGGSSTQATNHVKGANAKGVTLVEYGDFQCPVCGLYEPVVEQVYTKYQADIQFQFRNFPIQTVHQNAFAGARAAEAAAIQNKYWEMHDMLYQNQNSWSASTDPLSLYTQYAQSIGLNVDQFKSDFSSSKVNASVNADLAAANKLGVEATPTFYLNGQELKLENLVDSQNNQPSVDKFSKVIDDAIAKKGGSTTSTGNKQ